MPHTIAFYIHHHGSGHFMRSLAIAKALKHDNVVFLGSHLERFNHLLPENIKVINLPLDVPVKADVTYIEDLGVECFHYAPLQVKGITKRMAVMAKFFDDNTPVLLLVDVSVEITLLARLCAVPTIVIRQHGVRTDLAHKLAYQSAELLLAPFNKELETSKDQEITDKTFYSGGFARYKSSNIEVKTYPDQIAIIIGQGGTSLKSKEISFIANQCINLHFHILGEMEGSTIKDLTNLTFHGLTSSVEEILQRCGVVIGNLGHNTVMEIASLNKPFIGIPEFRPYNEQVDKAKAIANIEGVEIVFPKQIFDTPWKDLINKQLKIYPRLYTIIHTNALENISERIRVLAKSLFN